MCGIFGCALKPSASRRVALQKVKILGLYNIKRGKDASGIFVNGEIIKGINRISEFDDFIEDKIIPAPKDNAIMIGHTRAGSYGYKKTLDEAHPFLLNENMVFTHNGTIKNVKALCEKFNLTEADYSVDSQVLGTALDNNGKDVLESYVGAAALAYTYLNEPNVLYLYHGASKDYKHGKSLEERPLFYMETKDGIYYSSLEESLHAIKESEKEEPLCLDYNVIFKIKNGEWVLDDAIEIEREEANVSTYQPPVHVGKQDKASTTYMKAKTTMGGLTNSQGASISLDLIKKETLPIKLVNADKKEGFVYYHQGRFWEAPRKMLEGPIYLIKGGNIGTRLDNTSILHFFWRGVMIKDVDSYGKLVKWKNDELITTSWIKDPNAYNFALHISSFSPYPVTNHGFEGSNMGLLYRDAWYENGIMCKTTGFTPRFSSGRNYKIENGFLDKITVSQREHVLYNTVEIAQAEIKALLNGDTISGIPGGNPERATFQLGRTIETTIGKEGKNDILWFYEVPFTTYQKGTEAIGEEEINVLKIFFRKITLQECGLAPLDKEIEEEIKTMFQVATDKKCSLIDTLANENEKYTLINCYDEMIDKAIQEEDERIRTKNNLIAIRGSLTTSTSNIEEEEDETSEETIDENVENGITDIENLQTTSMELMNAQDSDYAQECAKIMIVGVDTMLVNLQNILFKYNKHDFVSRVKKIRETKNLKNGVL